MDFYWHLSIPTRALIMKIMAILTKHARCLVCSEVCCIDFFNLHSLIKNPGEEEEA
jgi:hypothetical protein